MSETLWVYLRSESELYTVGFYEPSGKWQPESDHGSPEDAARRVHFLNGGDESCGQPDRDARILAESNIELLKGLELLCDACDLFVHDNEEAISLAPAYEAGRELIAKHK